MHPHGIEVLDGADDDHVVLLVAHHLELVFLPADHRLLEKHLRDGRFIQPLPHELHELLAVVHDIAAGAAQRERRPYDERQLDALEHRERLVHRRGESRLRDVEVQLHHRLLEELAVLGLFDRFDPRADQPDAVLLEDARLRKRERDIERRLTAHRGQHRIGALALDDLLHDVGGNGLNIGSVGEVRIGHDGRGIGVHQDHLIALLAQRLACLRSGIIELARLSNHDGAGADDEDLTDAGVLGHSNLAGERQIVRW